MVEIDRWKLLSRPANLYLLADSELLNLFTAEHLDFEQVSIIADFSAPSVSSGTCLSHSVAEREL